MRKLFHVIFSLLIIASLLMGNARACLEVDINILKETCKDLLNQLIGYDAELVPLNQEFDVLQISIDSIVSDWAMLFIKRKELEESGSVTERIIFNSIMQLNELKKITLPWTVAVSSEIERLVRFINDKTLKLNVFRSEISAIDIRLEELKKQKTLLTNKQSVMAAKIRDLQIRIKYDEQSLKAAELSLNSKLERINIVEQNIKQTNIQAQIYSNSINILLNRISTLSASQQGSGGLVPEGLEELQRALQNQRALLSDALNRLEALHFEHGC